MSPRKSDPNKQATTIRIHQRRFRQLKGALPKYIGATGKIISFVDFTDLIISRGIKSLFRKAKY